MNKHIIALAVLLTAAGASQAQVETVTVPAQARFMAGIGLAFGGDKLAQVKYDDGTDQTIRAGSGVIFTGGVDFRVNPSFSVQGTINYHVDNTSASNGSVKMQRWPLEAVGFFHANEQWKVGGGLRYVYKARMSSSGAASNIGSANFDNTLSPVLEVEYLASPNTGVKVRYVKETFKEKGYYDTKANHFAISGVIYF